jgi:fatty-acyl-CoA synthase
MQWSLFQDGSIPDQNHYSWLPESWVFMEEIPKTSVGKVDKKLLRGQLAKGELAVVSFSTLKV